MLRARILGLAVDPVDLRIALNRVRQFLGADGGPEGSGGPDGEQSCGPLRPRRVVTLNAEMAYRSSRDPELRELVNSADLVTPDGSGILWAAARLGQSLPGRAAGIDLVEALAVEAAGRGWRVYLYGAAPGVALAAARNLRRLNPGLEVCGTAHGYLSVAEQGELLLDIRKKRPQLIFAALGFPRQEKWLAEHLPTLDFPVVGIGVGGSLDVLSGRARRAPVVIQRLRLEWLYRLLRNPRRLPRAVALPAFTWQVLRESRRRPETPRS